MAFARQLDERVRDQQNLTLFNSLCTIDLVPTGETMKLTITHTIERDPSKFASAVSEGWPQVISGLKSLIETGSVIAIQHERTHLEPERV